MFDGTHKSEFTDEQSIAKASEGFCPFDYHWGSEEDVKLQIVEDGYLICKNPNNNGDFVKMKFEWMVEE